MPHFTQLRLRFLLGIFLFGLVSVSDGANAIQVKRNLRYLPGLESDTTHTFDLYLPEKDDRNAEAIPLIVWIHGGGWAGGKKDALREVQVANSLAKAGFAVASINYTLATDEEPSWPTVLLDCKNAIRYLRHNADTWGIDPRRIGVAGGSAGAHLALMVAYTTGEENLEPASPYPNVDDSVGVVISLYGATNFLTRKATNRDGTSTGKPVSGRGIIRLLGQNRTVGHDLWQAASPASYVRAGIPPTYLSHGMKDDTVDYHQSVELFDMLQKAGVPSQLELLEHTGHTYSFTHRGKEPLERDLTPSVITFLKQHFLENEKTAESR